MNKHTPAELTELRRNACEDAFRSFDGREIPPENIEPGMVWEMRDLLDRAVNGVWRDGDLEASRALLAKLEVKR